MQQELVFFYWNLQGKGIPLVLLANVYEQKDHFSEFNRVTKEDKIIIIRYLLRFWLRGSIVPAELNSSTMNGMS